MSLINNIYPFENLQQFYGMFYLIQQAEGDYDFVCDSFDEIFGIKYDVISIKNIASKFLRLFHVDHNGLFELFKKLKKKSFSRKQYILPPVNQCIHCNFLLETFSSSQKIMAYCLDEPKLLYYNYCIVKQDIVLVVEYTFRKIEYTFRNYKRSNDEYFIYPRSISLKFLATSLETCFEIKLLKYLDEQIVRNGMTFDGFSDSYNQLYSNIVNERPLYRKRLAEAWYSYKIKFFLYNELNHSVELLDFKSDSKSTENFLKNKLPIWKDAFTIKWAQLHNNNCKIRNCIESGMFV